MSQKSSLCLLFYPVLSCSIQKNKLPVSDSIIKFLCSPNVLANFFNRSDKGNIGVNFRIKEMRYLVNLIVQDALLSLAKYFSSLGC